MSEQQEEKGPVLKVKNEDGKEDTLIMGAMDAAIILGIDGQLKLILPDARKDEMVAGNALFIAAVATLMSKKGQPFIDDIIGQFDAMSSEDKEMITKENTPN